MFEVPVDGAKVACDVTFDTALIYEQEFGGDIIADLFGRQTTDGALFVFDDEDLVGIDFTKVRWLSLTKVLWAAMKTADKSVAPYREWARDTGGVNLLEARRLMQEAVNDCFFRAEDSAEEAEG